MVLGGPRVPESQKIRIAVVPTGLVVLHFDDFKRTVCWVRLTRMSRVAEQ